MDSEAVEWHKVGVFPLRLAFLAVAAEAGGFFLVGIGMPIPLPPVLSDLAHRPEGFSLKLDPPDRRGESLPRALDQENLKYKIGERQEKGRTDGRTVFWSKTKVTAGRNLKTWIVTTRSGYDTVYQ